jgi:uncharacterized protein YegP (UPF0339 family)
MPPKVVHMAKFEIFRDARGDYRWRLRSANGQVFAIGGEGFKSRSGAETGIAAVKRDAPGANVDDQSESPVTQGAMAGRIEPGMAKKKMPPPM